jgi:hypothetical protein
LAQHLIVRKKIGLDRAFSPVTAPLEPVPTPPVHNRPAHASKLTENVTGVVTAYAERRAGIRNELRKDERGALMRFDARTEVGIDLQFFQATHGITLLKSVGKGLNQKVHAYASESSLKKLATAVERYGDWNEEGNRPRHFFFFEQIKSVAPTGIEPLWAGPPGMSLRAKATGQQDWEIWLRPEAFETVSRLAREFSLQQNSEPISFPNAVVVILTGTFNNLKELLEATAAAVEIRPASTIGIPPTSLTPRERVDLTRSLQGRLELAGSNAPRTAIIDTGVRHSHPLLAGSLPESRAHAIATGLQAEDAHGHGTQMAGAALFGDLTRWINGSTGPIKLTTALESVAIFNSHGAPFKSAAEALIAAFRLNEKEHSNRVYSLSFSLPADPCNGSPGALSSLIDRLSFGRDNPKRLFCIAAGNIDTLPAEVVGYTTANDESGIQSPGQSVNALTVGAYTAISGQKPTLGHAPAGDLCPTARTSISWEHRLGQKPDIVMEGGNLFADVEGLTLGKADRLSVLTTHHELPNRPFAAGTDTSIATAAAAGLCTRVMAAYPEFWPETVRGLVVHAARWTPAMEARAGRVSRSTVDNLLHRFGWGVPNEKRVFESANNALTMIIQDELQLLQNKNKKWQHAFMRYYRLPWPIDALEALGTADVSLRITLSYFTDPAPLALNAQRAQNYHSHHLKFDIKDPDDHDELAIARVNKLAREPGKKLPTRQPVGTWLLGDKKRSNGSIRQDIWTGRASDLSQMGAIAVYPQYGWWRNNSGAGDPLETVRFSLIASIETARIDVDLATETEASIATLKTRVPLTIET